MSGKKNKRNKRLERERAREEARRQQRRQTMFTLVVIGVIVAIGGVLIAVSLDDGTDPLADATEQPTDEATEDDRPVACGAEEPELTGEEKPTFSEPEDVLEEGVDYVATVETSCGTVVMDLHEEGAPETVNSFVFLAEQGFFDGLEIFRNATSIGALQTGAGTNEASWNVGYTLPDELDIAEEEGYPPGSVAMANAGPDTAGSQFFFVYNDQFDEAFADNRAYSRFAMVTEGMDVLTEIGAIPTGETPETMEQPQERVYIHRVTIGLPGEAAEEPTEQATDEGS